VRIFENGKDIFLSNNRRTIVRTKYFVVNFHWRIATFPTKIWSIPYAFLVHWNDSFGLSYVIKHIFLHFPYKNKKNFETFSPALCEHITRTRRFSRKSKICFSRHPKESGKWCDKKPVEYLNSKNPRNGDFIESAGVYFWKCLARTARNAFLWESNAISSRSKVPSRATHTASAISAFWIIISGFSETSCVKNASLVK